MSKVQASVLAPVLVEFFAEEAAAAPGLARKAG
jgi:hypothetical protein